MRSNLCKEVKISQIWINYSYFLKYFRSESLPRVVTCLRPQVQAVKVSNFGGHRICLHLLPLPPHLETRFVFFRQIVMGWIWVPYARHYNPRFVFFLVSVLFEVRFILQTTYGLNSSFFKPKIRGLYMRAVSNRERVIMARLRYIVLVISNNLQILGLQPQILKLFLITWTIFSHSRSEQILVTKYQSDNHILEIS